MARLSIKRGDILVTDLRPGIGWEVTKKRPALIISVSELNNISPTVVLIPISSQISKILGPERILLSKEDSNLAKDSVMLVHQIRAVDKKRLLKRVGKLSKEKLLEVEESIKLILGMTPLD